jgi:hypothetical protein
MRCRSRACPAAAGCARSSAACRHGCSRIAPRRAQRRCPVQAAGRPWWRAPRARGQPAAAPRRAARLSAGCQHGSSGQHDPQVKADRLAQPFHADTPSGSADSGWLPADIVMPAAFSDENSNAIDTAITATDRIGSTAAQMGTSKPQRQRPHPGDARTGSPWAETTPMHAHQGIAISRNNRCRATPDFSPVCRSGGLRG